jgi:hypothetical protein
VIAITSLNSVNEMIFIMVKCDVLFEVRTKLLNDIKTNFGSKHQNFALSSLPHTKKKSEFHHMLSSLGSVCDFGVLIKRSETLLKLSPCSTFPPIPSSQPNVLPPYQRDEWALPGDLHSRKLSFYPPVLNVVSDTTTHFLLSLSLSLSPASNRRQSIFSFREQRGSSSMLCEFEFPVSVRLCYYHGTNQQKCNHNCVLILWGSPSGEVVCDVLLTCDAVWTRIQTSAFWRNIPCPSSFLKMFTTATRTIFSLPDDVS